MEVVSTRCIHLTGSGPWDPSRYDCPSLPPTDPVDIHQYQAYLLNDDDASDGTSKTGNCDSLDGSADTDTINDVPETIEQVSFRYKIQ